MRILVTGAGGGIGSTIVEMLTGLNCTVETTTQADTDLSDPIAVQKLKKRVGAIDWIVCAHGFIDTETVLEKQTIEAIEKTFSINAVSLFLLAREFLNTIPQGGGVIALSSSAGIAPNGRFAAYSASKAAVNAFVQALACNRQDLHFYAVAPGPTNTAMRERVAHDAAHMQSPDVIATLVCELIVGNPEYKSGDVILVKDGVRSIVSRV